MKSGKIRKIILLLGIISFFAGCKKEETTAWDLDVLAPLAETTLTIGDIIPDSVLLNTPGDPLMIRYSRVFSLIPSDSLLRIPDTVLVNSYTAPVSGTVPTFDFLFLNEVLRFNFKDSRICEVIVKEGTSEIMVNSSVNEKLFFNYSIPKATKDGTFIQYTNEEIQPGTPTAQSVYSKVTDLSGYHFDLTGDNGLEWNRLRVSLNANPANPVAITANQELLNYRNSFKGIIPYYARGFLGTSVFETINESTDLQELKKLEGAIRLQNITMNLQVENSVGADFQVIIDKLKAVKTGSGQSVELNHTLIGNPQQIGRAQHFSNGTYPYTPVVKNYSLTTANSNLKEFIELLPDRLEYSVSTQVNPLGNISANNDFIYNTSNVKIGLELNLPLAFSANALTFRDTIETAGIATDKSEPFRAGELKILADNGFPFELRLVGYLLDKDHQLLDSLLTADEIAAAPVNQNLQVIQPVRSVLKIPVTERLKSNLAKSKYIVLKARLNTQPEQTILPMYADYSLKLKLVGDGTYRVSVK